MFLLAQLSDPHVGARWDGRDPVARLAAAVDAVAALEPRPAAVLVSGDLADHAADDEYVQVRTLLEPLGLPLHVLPGNHDARAALRRHFELPGAGDEPIRYAADLGALRLVALDTTIPGEDGGELGAEALAWLDRVLAEAPGAPTLIAMHHPPLVTGIPPMDAIGLPDGDRRALGELVARHPHVRRIVAGHVHRAMTAGLGGCAVLVAPSTYMPLRLDFAAPSIAHSGEAPGFALHMLRDGELTSHVVEL